MLDAIRHRRARRQIPVVTMLPRETTPGQREQYRREVEEALRGSQTGPDEILEEVRRWTAARV